LAIDDDSGSVLYVPDAAETSISLQLFVDSGARIERIRADGAFDSTYAILEVVTTVEPSDDCSDGPCVEWGAGCGGGCVCQKYEITNADPDYMSAINRSGPGRMYGLRCQ
jgi:hypothetical protein